MRVLITGGCGFLGSNLAAHALRRSDELLIFDNLGRTGAAQNLSWLRTHGAFEFVTGDIRRENDVADVVAAFRPEAIFHLAGQVAMTTSIADPRSDFETNAIGTLNLLESVRKHAPRATVLYSSTNKVYGDLTGYDYEERSTRYICADRPHGFDESTPLEFHSPYGCSKGTADQYVLDYARVFGLNTAVFRHSSMYGGRQFATYDQGWVGWFCQKAIEFRDGRAASPFTISGDGKQVRDVLHADDMVTLYFKAIDRIGPAKGHAFNIGGGMANSLSLLELFALLESLTGITLKFERLPWRASDQKVFVADIRKANRLLGWYPEVTPRSGVKAMLEWLSTLDGQGVA